MCLPPISIATRLRPTRPSPTIPELGERRHSSSTDGRWSELSRPRSSWRLSTRRFKKAEGLIARGTKPEQIYGELDEGWPSTPGPCDEKHSKVAALEWTFARQPASQGDRSRICRFRVSVLFARRSRPRFSLDDFGSKVRLVWHDMPLSMHPHAMLAARAAREMLAEKGIEAFWRFHDKLLSNQDALTREHVDGYASEMHAVPARWKEALDGSLRSSEIDADVRAAADAGITGTPAFLVVAGAAEQGYFIEGAQTYWTFRKVIARALGEEP